MRIQNNMLAMMAANDYKVVVDSKKKTTERLSSGYRINKAADDAVNLCISEKMRAQIRGLDKAVDNVKKGADLIQTGDGTMGEMEDILHRMKELSVASLNGTYTDEDRSLMEGEFEELQSQLDEMSGYSEFNTIPIFEQHEPTYYSIEGNRRWLYDQPHKITDDNNNFKITVKEKDDTGAETDKTYEITVPPGTYTTQELIDEIDDAFDSQAGKVPGFVFEYTKDGYCNMNYEGGKDIVSIGGGLSYLIYDSYTRSGDYGSLIGTTVFAHGYPLDVTNYNNKLQFTIEDLAGNSRRVDITVPPGKYSKEEMIDFLNQEFENQGIAGIRAKEHGADNIEIGGDYLVTGLKGNMFEIDEMNYSSVFYDNTFYGNVTHTTGTFTGGAYFTTDPADTEYYKTKIDSTNHILKVRVNGEPEDTYETIELPQPKEYTVDELAAALDKAFQDKGLGARVSALSSGGFKRLAIVSDITGPESKIEFDKAGSTAYNTLFCHMEYLNRYNVLPKTGTNGYTTEPYAKGGKDLSGETITVAPPKDELALSITDSTGTANYTLKLPAGTYAGTNALVSAINAQIAAGGVGISGKITAVNDGGKIKLTTTAAGNDINAIKFGNTGSANSLYQDLMVGGKMEYDQWTKNGSSVTLPGKVPDNVNLTNSNNNLYFYVDGVYKSVTVPAGTYTKEELAQQITNAFPPVSDTVVNHVNVSGSGSAQHVEGTTIPSNETPASVLIPNVMDPSVTIDASNNVFNVTLNEGKGEKEVSITIPSGAYDRETFAKKITEQFKAKGIGITAAVEGGRLRLTTTAKGENVKLSVKSETGGSAMSAIAGTTTKKFDGVEAEINSSGQLVLKSGGSQNISINNNYGSMMEFLNTQSNKVVNPEVSGRYTQSSTKSYIDGASLGSDFLKDGKVPIDSRTKELAFTYNNPSGTHAFSMNVPEKDYTFSELQSVLQNEINHQLGSNELKVTVNASGVRIEAVNAGSSYNMSGFSGGFHSYVISGSRVVSAERLPTAYDGIQKVNSSYIVGRQDIRNEGAQITAGYNDNLILDFTYPDSGVTKELSLSLKLDSGTYTGQSLVDMIQKKLDEQLEANGLKAGMVKAGLGGISTQVVGNNDQNVLNFSLSDQVGVIEPGQYKIDGVRGTAAFSVFYKTDGLPVPSYIVGTKDISKGVEILPDKNEFSFVSDGEKFEYELPPGKYSAEGFAALLNDMFQNGDKNGNTTDAVASVNGKYLKLEYLTTSGTSFDDIEGSGRGLFLFEEKGEEKEDYNITLQVGANEGQVVDVKKFPMNTCFMKLNSLTISGYKYARKALERLDYALNYLNRNRGTWGAYVERLDKVVNGNETGSENLSSTESRIRDADMAKEMLEHSRNQILSKASESVMAQANQSLEGYLRLLDT